MQSQQMKGTKRVSKALNGLEYYKVEPSAMNFLPKIRFDQNRNEQSQISKTTPARSVDLSHSLTGQQNGG